MSAIVFLGGGRITSALCAGLRMAGDSREIVVYDRNPEKLHALRRESHIVVARDLKTAVRRAAMVIVAVRPASVMEVLRKLVECGTSPGLCLSLAAGVPLKNLKAWLPDTRWVRAMPSPVARVGRGLTAICFDRSVSVRERHLVREFFARVGPVVEVTERKFDAFTATYSSSHGYHALAALAAAAEKAGLDRKTALLAAAHALADGISYCRESGMELAELLHEAATPGGIAAATMKGMDRAGYQRAVEKGLRAGIARARKNAGSRKSEVRRVQNF